VDWRALVAAWLPCLGSSLDREIVRAHRRSSTNAAEHEVVVDSHPGYSPSASATGLCAMRVPLPNLAGQVEPDASIQGGSQRMTHLELIIQAAARTGDFSAFNSQIIHALTDYKWKCFAGRQFLEELLGFCAHLVVVYMYASQLRLASALTHGELMDALTRAEDHLGPLLVLGWLWTTGHALWVLVDEMLQMRRIGIIDYITDEWNVLDLLGTTVQSLASVYVALLVLAPADLSDAFRAYSILRIGTLDHTGHAHICENGRADARGLCPERVYEEIDEPFAYDGQLLPQEWQQVLNLTSLVIILSSLRLFYYMRGFQQLGALVQMIASILRDMGPFIVVAIVIMFSFSFALTIAPSGVRPLAASLWLSMNMGLYGEVDGNDLFHAGAYVTSIAQLFMFTVQIVLLNLLIAIMADSYRRVQARTLQAALFERARVVAKLERSPGVLRRMAGKLSSQAHVLWIREPTWLHVLDNDIT